MLFQNHGSEIVNLICDRKFQFQLKYLFIVIKLKLTDIYNTLLLTIRMYVNLHSLI
jgi:hypothetical protein